MWKYIWTHFQICHILHWIFIHPLSVTAYLFIQLTLGKQPFTLTDTSRQQTFCMSLDSGRTPEYRERTHADNKQTLHRKGPAPVRSQTTGLLAVGQQLKPLHHSASLFVFFSMLVYACSISAWLLRPIKSNNMSGLTTFYLHPQLAN